MKIFHFKIPKLKRLFYLFLILIAIFLILLWNNYRFWYLKYIYIKYNLENDFILNNLKKDKFLNSSSTKVFKSKCECRKDDVIELKLENENCKVINKKTKSGYAIEKSFLDESILTCDLYSSLRRGPNQKIISFSLYGKNQFYYIFLKTLVKSIYKLYPDWFIRIYHDSSIDESIICELECLKMDKRLEENKSNSSNSQNYEYYDIVDMCNIEKLPIDFNIKNTWNASYMHGMTWRWLPLGDSFVDYFSSRDTDAWMTQREVDSVNVWLNENTLFHVMRGNFYYKITLFLNHQGLLFFY